MTPCIDSPPPPPSPPPDDGAIVELTGTSPSIKFGPVSSPICEFKLDSINNRLLSTCEISMPANSGGRRLESTDKTSSISGAELAALEAKQEALQNKQAALEAKHQSLQDKHLALEAKHGALQDKHTALEVKYNNVAAGAV
jgi:hypothetical protein